LVRKQAEASGEIWPGDMTLPIEIKWTDERGVVILDVEVSPVSLLSKHWINPKCGRRRA
jgi:hypothetical protein